MKTIIQNARVFSGQKVLTGHDVEIDGKYIGAIYPSRDANSAENQVIDLGGCYLVPGFIDLQVNGGGGVLFNHQPSVQAIKAIAKAHRRFGTTGFLVTLISDTPDTIRQAIGAVDAAIQEGVPGLLGIHLEGPFLNVQKRGIHNATKISHPDEQTLSLLTSLKYGKTMVTLAPETVDSTLIKRLSEAGVLVSAGHTMANYRQMKRAIEAGVQGATHLFNAMPSMTSREPGIIGAVIEDDQVWFSIIADGHHVHPAMVKMAVKAKAIDKTVLVTDAMSLVGSDRTWFDLEGERIELHNGALTNPKGTLAGSNLNMFSAVDNVRKFVGIDWAQAVSMASSNVAKVLSVEDVLGYIRPGHLANMVAIDPQRSTVTHTWINGALSDG